ncbi:MAG: BatD family protein, partial [Opitutae bacterium]|nr:BatD family protein [Opitutae bacterium]
PVRFTYFDPKSGTYKTIASEPVSVTVTAGTAPVQAPAGSGAPVQFSLTPPAATTAPAPVQPAAVPPVPPENLPRDPLAESATGFMPLPARTLAVLSVLSSVLCVAAVWLVLAALRSRENDPERLRRAARAKLAATLAELRLAASKLGEGGSAISPRLRVWQAGTAALWEVPHAAPGSLMVHAYVGTRSRDAASAWARLWSEADRALHSRDQALPPDWMNRAEGALQAVKVPGWPPLSLFTGRNLLPFLYVLFGLYVLWVPSAALAAAPADAYKAADFPAAEAGWRTALAANPADWTNLGLALAQQDRWAEATAHWTGAFLLNARADTTRWDLALGLQRSGLAPPELVELSRGEGRAKIVRLATPGEWQLALIAAALLFAAALIVLLLQGYRRIGAWGKPVALTACLLAMLLAAAATFSLHTYGALAHPGVALVWKPSQLRSIPTEADTTQKTSPLSAGSIAVVEKTFLGWSKLNFAAGQSGWIRTEDLISLYR